MFKPRARRRARTTTPEAPRSHRTTPPKVKTPLRQLLQQAGAVHATSQGVFIGREKVA